MEDILNEYNSKNEEVENLKNELHFANISIQSEKERLAEAIKEFTGKEIKVEDLNIEEISSQSGKDVEKAEGTKVDVYDTQKVDEYRNQSLHSFVVDLLNNNPEMSADGASVIKEYIERVKAKEENAKEIENKINNANSSIKDLANDKNIITLNENLKDLDKKIQLKQVEIQKIQSNYQEFLLKDDKEGKLPQDFIYEQNKIRKQIHDLEQQKEEVVKLLGKFKQTRDSRYNELLNVEPQEKNEEVRVSTEQQGAEVIVEQPETEVIAEQPEIEMQQPEPTPEVTPEVSDQTESVEEEVETPEEQLNTEKTEKKVEEKENEVQPQNKQINGEEKEQNGQANFSTPVGHARPASVGRTSEQTNPEITWIPPELSKSGGRGSREELENPEKPDYEIQLGRNAQINFDKVQIKLGKKVVKDGANMTPEQVTSAFKSYTKTKDADKDLIRCAIQENVMDPVVIKCIMELGSRGYSSEAENMLESYYNECLLKTNKNTLKVKYDVSDLLKSNIFSLIFKQEANQTEKYKMINRGINAEEIGFGEVIGNRNQITITRLMMDMKSKLTGKNVYKLPSAEPYKAKDYRTKLDKVEEKIKNRSLNGLGGSYPQKETGSIESVIRNNNTMGIGNNIQNQPDREGR